MSGRSALGRVRSDRRLERWALGCVCLGLAITVVSYTRFDQPAVGWQVVRDLAVPILGLAWMSHWSQGRRRRWFLEDLGGSLGRAREVLDVNVVRSVRATRGEMAAVREVRHQLPQLSLTQSLDLLRSL